MDEAHAAGLNKDPLHPQPTNIITIERNLIEPFFDLLHTKHGLLILLAVPESLVESDKLRGISSSADELRIIEKFVKLKKDLQSLGIDELPEELAYRFVSFESMEDVDDAIEVAGIHGGKNPSDSRIGICVSKTAKAFDIAHVDLIQNNKPGILFIYDNSKLQPLTKEEIEADKTLNFVGGYGVKPKAGTQLKDAIVATIKMENPGVRKNLTYSL